MVFLLIVSAVSFPQVQTTSNVSQALTTTIEGCVIDTETDQPLQNATVMTWQISRTSYGYKRPQLIDVVKTNASGFYRVSFEGSKDLNYRVYACFDDPSTPGYDYLPQYYDVITGSEANKVFKLISAASMIFEGELLFVDYSDPPEEVIFTVVLEQPTPLDYVMDYGYEWEAFQTHTRYLNLSSNHAIVPANTSIQISVKAAFNPNQIDEQVYLFTIDDPTFLFHQGELLRVDVMPYLLPYNLNITRHAIQQTETHFAEVEQKGLYTISERQGLKEAWTLFESAESKCISGDYIEGYTDLRAAHVKTIHLDGTIQRMYLDASTSVYIIIVFLAFMSTALSHIFFEYRIKKVVTTGILYVIFLGVLFNVYFGAQIVEFTSFMAVSLLAIVVFTLLGFLLSRVFRQTLVVTFSLAKRNLLRRKLRFSLTLATIIVMVMAFVSLTSFTKEHGFLSKVTATATRDSEGLLIRPPLPRIPFLSVSDPPELVASFTPLEVSDVERLKRTAEVTLVAPKVENFASRNPLASLSSMSVRLSVYGILGLSLAEAEITGVDDLLVEGTYRYDDENDFILISVQASKMLDVEVGEQLVLDVGIATLEVTLVGLLDDDLLSQATDLDGAPLRPKTIVVFTDQSGQITEVRLDLCDPSEVILIDWQTALQLQMSALQLSRLDVLVEDSVDPLAFARQMALNRDFWVWAVADQEISFFGFMTYLSVKGLSIFIPWLIVVLTVMMTMFSAIYDRQHEVVTLSAVGLNPTHITYIFAAEAVIIGIIGGGVGYLLGQGSYKVANLLAIDVLVEQKTSAVWSFASLGIALAAVLAGAFTALKFSTIITPSLLLRWSVQGIGHYTAEPLVIELPFMVREADLNSLFDFVANRFRRYLHSIGVDEASGRIEFLKDETLEPPSSTVNFKYLLGDRPVVGSLPFQLVAKKQKGEKTYSLEVNCRGSEQLVEQTVSFLRASVIEWSARKEHNIK